jgi:sugar phosphate isomerase/epimerase
MLASTFRQDAGLTALGVVDTVMAYSESNSHEVKLSCADSTFPRLSHEAALIVIRDLGFSAVDVCSFAGYRHTPPAAVLADPTGTARTVRQRLERVELEISDVFMILGTSFHELALDHPDAAVRERAWEAFERFVEFSVAIGAPGITVLPGVAFEGEDEEACRERAAAELSRRSARAAEAGLRLSFEPHYGSIAQTPERTLELLDRAPGVHLALDHSHFVYQGIAQEDVDVLIPHARHVHLRQAAPGSMQLPARTGVIDFRLLVERLRAGGYEGYLCLEYQWEEWLDCNRVDCISETAELRDVLLA